MMRPTLRNAQNGVLSKKLGFLLICGTITLELHNDMNTVKELYPLSSDYDYLNDSPELMSARVMGNPTRIRIKDEWFDVLPLMQVARSKSPEDGAFHFL